MQADSIKIESEEDGFHLVLQLDEEIPMVTNEGRLDVRIDGCAEALHEQVNLMIGGWLAEGHQAKREVDSDDRKDFASNAERNAGVFFCNPDESAGYSTEPHRAVGADELGPYGLDDPKHPAFHSVHADIWDAREGK